MRYEISTTGRTFYASEDYYPSAEAVWEDVNRWRPVECHAHGARGGVDPTPLHVTFNPGHVIAVIAHDAQ